MIDTRLKLSVLHDDNASFTDYSNDAVDFSRDNFAITLNATDDKLYIGFSKPFNAAYCEFVTPNVTANSINMEYHNGTDWVALADARDLTKGFTRSGYLSWTKPDNWAANQVNSVSKYWIRLACSVTHSATTVSGINLIFADDYDLQTEFPAVIDAGFIPVGEVSHIKTHVAARNQIIQDLRNKGAIKMDASGNWQNITPWDLLDIEEIKQAATCLALSKIFFNYSDEPNDHWMLKSKIYGDRYRSQMDAVKLTIDKDDDGVTDDADKTSSKTIRMVR